jgi:hypothetical protein
MSKTKTFKDFSEIWDATIDEDYITEKVELEEEDDTEEEFDDEECDCEEDGCDCEEDEE